MKSIYKILYYILLIIIKGLKARNNNYEEPPPTVIQGLEMERTIEGSVWHYATVYGRALQQVYSR